MHNEPMKYYFLFIAISLLVGALFLVYNRLQFIGVSQKITGKVAGISSMNYSAEDTGGKSKHIKVAYTDAEGKDKIYTADNSLLVYFYQEGQLLKLALHKDRVLINTIVGIYTAPIFIFILGLVVLFLFQSMD